MDSSRAHILINRLLEGTQYSATTTDSQTPQGRSCRVLVRWWPTRKQFLKRPKDAYETAGETWQEAHDAVKAWVEAGSPAG